MPFFQDSIVCPNPEKTNLVFFIRSLVVASLIPKENHLKFIGSQMICVCIEVTAGL